MDPMVGADQSRETYWVHIKEYFDGENTSGIERTERSLRSRWGVINADCQKWAGVQKHVDELNPSGYGDFDRLTVAQNLFRGNDKKTKKGKLRKGRPFTLAHCYKVLDKEEKWRN